PKASRPGSREPDELAPGRFRPRTRRERSLAQSRRMHADGGRPGPRTRTELHVVPIGDPPRIALEADDPPPAAEGRDRSERLAERAVGRRHDPIVRSGGGERLRTVGLAWS